MRRRARRITAVDDDNYAAERCERMMKKSRKVQAEFGNIYL